MFFQRRNKLIVLFYILIIILSRVLTLAAEISSGLSIFVKADKKNYRMGENIELTVSLKNTGDKPLALFHPDTMHKLWFDWQLTVTVTRPDSMKLGLEPDIFYSMHYFPEKEHYIVLAPGEEINIPVSFSAPVIKE